MLFSTEKASSDYLHVNSCGIQELWDRDCFTVRETGRIDYHILYILQGQCLAESRGKEVTLNEGDLILFMPWEKQKYIFRAKHKPISAYFHFAGTGCEEMLGKLGLCDKRVLRIGKSSTIKTIFEKISDECLLKKPFYTELCAAYLLEFLSVVGRKVSYAQNQPSTKNSRLIDAVCKKMLEEHTKAHPIKYYADCCNLSVSRFSYVFKTATGLTPIEYINRIRIDRAKEILLNTNLSVSEVAEIVGFCDQNYMSRLFKRYVGVSPKKYSIV